MSAYPKPFPTSERLMLTPSLKSIPDRTGTLLLVVGPSGVGKDTLIDGARASLAHRPDIVFSRREITRAADAGGEDHIAVSPAEFRSRLAAGAYLLHWEAHGLGYAIPASVLGALNDGRHVFANVSRSVIADARSLGVPVRVLSIEAPEAVLRQRLSARGRETAADVQDRLARATAFPVTGDDVVTIVNDGTVEDGVARLMEAVPPPLDLAIPR